jgi:cell division septation protein DedD
MDSPPKARPKAAAKVVRAFLVVIIAISFDGTPEGNQLKEAGFGQLLSAYVSIRTTRSGSLQEEHVGPQLSLNAAQQACAGGGAS